MTKSKSRKSGKSHQQNRAHRKAVRSTRDSASRSVKKRTAGASVSIASRPNGKGRLNTKQAQVIAILQAPAGATIDALMQATGWQQHSVRGFLAAVVRKKLGLELTSKADESGRVYRIIERTIRSAA